VSRIDIARPPDEVFAYATDPRGSPRGSATWCGSGSRETVRPASARGSPPPAGSVAPSGPWPRRSPSAALRRAGPPAGSTGRSGPTPPSPWNHSTAAPAPRVTFALDFEGHGIGRPLLPAVRRQTQKAAPVSYRNLKVRLEGDGR